MSRRSRGWAGARETRAEVLTRSAGEANAASSRRPSGRLIALAATVAGIAAALLYVRTLWPTVGPGDSGELVSAAWTLGIAHPPGYPTWTVLSHVFAVLVAIGDPAWRMNLLSAVLDAWAVALTVGLSTRLSTRLFGTAMPPFSHVTAGVIAGGFLAVSTAFWQYSLVAEVFALNNVLAIGLLWAMLEWSWRPSRSWLLWLAGALAGLALTNQQTIVLLAPALLTLLAVGLRAVSGTHATGARVRRGRQAATESGQTRGSLRDVTIGGALMLTALLPYLYLPLAGSGEPAIAWGDPTSLAGFVDIVSRSSYGTLSLTVRDTAGSPLVHLALLLVYVVRAFAVLGAVLAILGLAVVLRRDRGVALALTLALVVTGPVFVMFANPPLDDPVTRGVLERFYILPSIVVAVLAGVAIAAAIGWASSRFARVSEGRWAAIAACAAGVVILGGAAIRFDEVDRSTDRIVAEYAADILEPLPSDAILLMRSDENYTAVVHAQLVSGLRPDVVAIDTELLKLPSYVERLRRRHPDIAIPFASYDGGNRTSLLSLVEQNRGVRSIHVIGELEEDLELNTDEVVEGLTRRLVPAGEAPDALAGLRADPGIWERLRVPERTYPDTTWEAAIASRYGRLAFQLGVARQLPRSQRDAVEIERAYRDAIRLDPRLEGAYKNLGVLLQTNGGPPEAIIAAWERFLELAPDDPEAGAIRAAIEELRGS